MNKSTLILLFFLFPTSCKPLQNAFTKENGSDQPQPPPSIPEGQKNVENGLRITSRSTSGYTNKIPSFQNLTGCKKEDFAPQSSNRKCIDSVKKIIEEQKFKSTTIDGLKDFIVDEILLYMQENLLNPGIPAQQDSKAVQKDVLTKVNSILNSTLQHKVTMVPTIRFAMAADQSQSVSCVNFTVNITALNAAERDLSLSADLNLIPRQDGQGTQILTGFSNVNFTSTRVDDSAKLYHVPLIATHLRSNLKSTNTYLIVPIKTVTQDDTTSFSCTDPSKTCGINVSDDNSQGQDCALFFVP